jgi:3-deoxy-D-manno-octulosonic-acid transferase
MNLLALFNAKVKRGIDGRKRMFERLIIDVQDLDKRKKLIWFHSASLGEFEQAKPIIEHLHSLGIYNILVTFFSPSGYENSKNYKYADIITYLPFDKTGLIRKFLLYVKPSLVVFMRYDVWPNLLYQLGRKNVPTLLVDATLRESLINSFFVTKSFYRKLYNDITRILTVTQKDKENFIALGVEKSKIDVAGDTRFDRVYGKSREASKKNLLDKEIFGEKPVFIMGSSWEADEEVVFPAIKKLYDFGYEFVTIVVPHEPTSAHIEGVENYFRNDYETIRFSEMRNYKSQPVIIVDSIGILLSLYYYSDIAYVGGSFKQIHNVLEPAVFGVPVLFGPKIETSREANDLVKLGSGIIVRDKKEAYKKLRFLLSNEKEREKLGEISAEYVKRNVGATEKIVLELHKFV